MSSSETTRIIGLPVRSPPPADLCERLSASLRTERGTQTLWPMQAEALLEAVRQRRVSPERGVFVRGGIGTGKTLPGLLFATVIQPPSPGKRALYLCPAALRDKTLRELPEYRRNWKIRADLLVHSYEELGADQDTARSMLERLNVYLVVADECQAIKNFTAGRTKKVMRTARRDPGIVWVMMSATPSTRGIGNSAHLFELALRSGSPLPRNASELESWARCVDSTVTAEAADWGMIRPLVENFGSTSGWDGPSHERVRACRQALNTRVEQTHGVVTGARVDVDSRLIMRRVTFDCPQEITDALQDLTQSGSVPGSSGAATIGMDKARSESQLCMGFYYRWAWEKTSGGEPDQKWLADRREWSSAMNEYLVPGGQGEREGIDTMRQMVLRMKDMPAFVRKAWANWEPQRNRYRIEYVGEKSSGVGEPIPVEPVWLTTAIVDRMVERLTSRKGSCILWYKHKAVAHELRRRGMRVVLSGEDLPWKELQGDGRPVALSEFSHAEGLNLQAWSRMVVTCPGPARQSPGAQIEQQVGRVHRSGQDADEVVVDFWQHAPPLVASLETALREARYIEDAGGLPQRLNFGEWRDVRQ